MTKRGRDLSSLIERLDDEADVAAMAPAAHPAETTADKLVPLNILVTKADRDRLNKLKVDVQLSVQKMGHEAWNMWLESRGLAPLEAVTANVPSGRSKR